jgi:hypothetical protein
VLDGESYRKKTQRNIELSAASCEESQRELKSLIGTAVATIQETRALIAQLDKILAKRQ